METRAVTSNQSALSRPSFVPPLIALMLLLLSAVPPAHAAKVTDSSWRGAGQVYAAVWCNPNAPPALPSAAGFGVGTFSIPGTPPDGLPLPAGCNPATFANAASGVGWRDISKAGATGGDSVDGSVDLLSLLTPVSYSSTASLDISASIIDANSVLFDVKYSDSDAGAGSEEYWHSAATGLGLIDPKIQIGESGELMVTITDPEGYEDILLDTEVAAKSLPTPESATLGLLGSAIVGVSGYLRRRLTRAG